ncbi:MAG: DUF4397 domain-containing protein [Ginsengibacter sp.]
MKKKLFSILQNKFLYLALFSVVAFSACKKDDVPSTPTAGLMAFNLIADSTPPVVFVLNNNSITNQALAYSSFTGTYLPIYTGPRTLEVYKQSNTDSALATESFTVEPNKYYSAFVMGANGTYKNMIVDDALGSLPDSTGKAFVRYVNAIPDSSNQNLTVSASGMDDVTGVTHYGQVSSFTGVTPGDFSLNITNDSTISANKTITFEKDKVYTVLLSGMPHATDTAKAVKISYVVNGTISK